MNSEHNASWYTYNAITSWKIYHFHDTSKEAGMRRYNDQTHNEKLFMDGSNIAPFLLNVKESHPDAYSEMINAIRLVIPFFDDFILEPNSNEKLRLNWRQKGLKDYPMKPTLLSDGSIRFVCLAAALLQPDPPSTIIIDEPELGLHPGALAILAELIEDASRAEDEFYQFIVDGNEEQLILGIEKMKQELEQNKDDLIKIADLHACRLGVHLFQPLFHIRKDSKISITPVALNESEFQFVTDLKDWVIQNQSNIKENDIELFLLRNLSRGKGVGFFEAGGFHPDFILWMIIKDKQYITFLEPHGLRHEGAGSDKVLFHERIKDIEKRLGDPDIVLNSFILSWTEYAKLSWGSSQGELEDQHILFMRNDREQYLDKLFYKLHGGFPPQSKC